MTEEQMEQAIPNSESSFKKLFTQLNEAWQLFVNNFWRLMGLSILGIVIPMALIIFAMVPIFGPLFFAKALGEYMPYFTTFGGVTGIVIFLMAILLAWLGKVTIYFFISRENEAKIGESIKSGLRLFFPFIGGIILVGLMTSIGVIFLVIPGLILAIFLSVWPFILVKENLGVIGSIKKSFSLIKGFFWVFCLRYLEAYLMTVLVFFAAILLVFVSFWVNLIAGVIMSIICCLAYIVYGLFLKYFYYVLYKNVFDSKNNNQAAQYKLNGKEWTLLVVLILIFIFFHGFASYYRSLYPISETKNMIETPSTSILPQNNVGNSLSNTTASDGIIKFRDDMRMKNMEEVKIALDEYANDHNGEYPITKGKLGDDLYCLVDYAAQPEISGFISRIENIEYLKLCEEANKIYLGRTIFLVTKGDFFYESICINKCLPDEKNNFYEISFSLEENRNNLKAGENCLTPNGFSPGRCVGAEVDSDDDGLSDLKEIHIYGTDFENIDTDGDGYIDGDEVKNGYDPLSSGKI
jgi:hypothetical protein